MKGGKGRERKDGGRKGGEKRKEGGKKGEREEGWG
jgi:hypothetical protein